MWLMTSDHTLEGGWSGDGWGVWAAPDGLVLVKRCGEGACDKFEYCSDGSCHNCSGVCSPPAGPSSTSTGGGHNFDAQICEKNCQDYIHDKVRHYLTYAEARELQHEARGELLETMDGLRTMVALSLTLSLVVGVAMLAGLAFAWVKYRDLRRATSGSGTTNEKFREKKISAISSISKNVGNNNKVQSEGVGGTSVVTATTPISTRHPSEDTTLEGYAYDNPAMNSSPVLTDSRGETHF